MAFVLASGSPHRQRLLETVAISPDRIFPCDVDETVFKAEKPTDYVRRVSRLKAEIAHKSFSDDIILAADTIVVMGRRIFQKPVSKEDAEKMLTLFSGRRLQVYTCVIVKNNSRMIERLVLTRVSLKRLSHQEIRKYLATNEWQGVSGGLCVEKYAGRFIQSINGSLSNLMGLPLCETCNILESIGYKSETNPGC